MLYLIKSAITLALLYSCFFFFLSKETFHRFNRCMLVGFMLVSLVVPLLHFTTEHPTVINEEFYQMQTFIEEGTMPEVVVPTEKAPRITWVQVVESIYLTGVAVMLTLTLVQILSLVRLMHKGLRHTDAQGNTVVLLKGDVTPFSIFRYIVMSVHDYEHHRQHILTHEQEHIRLGHTYDLLLMEAMKTFQWFNPFVWFISRDLKAVHEYEADQAVINQGIDAKQYQQLLVTKVVGDRLQPFTNNLGHGSLKKRILMMYQKKSNRWLMLKALCAIPVVALTINAFATPSDTDPVENMVTTLEKTEVPVINTSQSGSIETLVPQQDTPKTEAIPEDKTPFAIHPVRDSYNRIVGFSHEGEPADCDKAFNCTYEYVFIDGRPATEEEVRNYQSLPLKIFMLKQTDNGTAEYNYKDKHGIICFITKDATSMEQDDNEPLLVVDGKFFKVPLSLRGKSPIEDEDTAELFKAVGINNEDDVESLTILEGTPATTIYGDRAKNGAIVIKTKALREQPLDSVVVYHGTANYAPKPQE